MRSWGAREAERNAASPADAALPDATEHWVRAVDIAAPPALVWRWLCQLRAAPYSYDWIDNRGRRSPRQLTPGLDDLEVGQRLLTIFTVASFERDRELTIVTRPRSGLLPPFAMAYVVSPAGEHASRLVLHICVQAPRALPAPAARAVLAALCAGDLVMARRQLLNFKALSERDAPESSIIRTP